MNSVVFVLAFFVGAVAAESPSKIPNELDKVDVETGRVCKEGATCDSIEGMDADPEKLSLLQTELKVVGSAPRSAPVHSHKTETALPAHKKALWTKVEKPDNGLLQSQSLTAATARAMAWVDANVGSKVGLKGAGFALVFVGLSAIAVVVCLFIFMSRQTPGSTKGGQDPFRADGIPSASNTTANFGAGERSPSQRSPLMPAKMSPQQPQTNMSLPSQQSLVSAGQASQMSSGRLFEAARDESARAKEAYVVPEVPAICPSLILPHTEARFMIPVDAIQRLTTGSIDIMGTSGRKLLHAMVCDSPDGRRCLMLASCGCEDDPRACVFTSPDSSSGPKAAENPLEIFGKSGKFYGWLEFPADVDNKKAVLMHSGPGGVRQAVLQFDMRQQADLQIEASMMDGQPLASCGVDRADVTSWRLQAKPGADAVLVGSCFLALIILRAWPQD